MPHLSDEASALCHKQAALVALMERFMPTDGAYPAPIDGLIMHRLSAPSPPAHGIQKPTFCLAVQGTKSAVLGEDVHLHDPSRYLLVSADLPLTAQIVEATPETPYLGFCLDLDLRQIGVMLMEMDLPAPAAEQTSKKTSIERGLSLSRTDAPLLDAVLRLLCLLDTPEDIPMLAPLARREIFYRLLTGEQGPRLRQLSVNNSLTQRVSQAIHWLQQHYAEPLRIDTLAGEVCMSVSGLHHHFKAVTALSPLQYQKHLRLQEARRLLLGGSLDAATAGYQVGYQSPSQFSREYRRLFGAPPRQDLSRLRGAA